jgi:protein-disulfide isomerase
MKKGVDNVAALKGGWAAWLQAGYPVEGRQVPTPPPAANADEQPGILGSADAPVTIVEYSDYQCPYCRRHVMQTMPQIQKAYIDTGKIRYIFKDFPLDFHPNASKAAEAARCAGAQGAFWAMHDRLFDSQGEWSPLEQSSALDTFVSYAQDMELDTSAFRTCLETGQFAAQIARDVQEGRQAGVEGTPSFLIDAQLVPGAYPFERFEQIIEAELDQKP